MPHFDDLRVIDLAYMQELDSLRFLTAGSLPRTLTQLSLYYLRRGWLCLAELQHVHALQSLTQLKVLHSLADPMDALTQSLYAPPSKLMPNLREFSYAR